MTRFLYFDMGNVLVHFDHEIALANLALVSGATRADAFGAIFETGLGSRYERGAVSTAEFCATLRTELDTSISDEAICLAISDMFSLNTSTLALAAALKSQHFPIGILSNTCHAHWDFIKNRYSFSGMFPVHVLSFELQTAKPEPEIFVKASQLAGVAPQEIFFTDDLPTNVEAAKAAGFDAALFSSADQLAIELKERGISVDI